MFKIRTIQKKDFDDFYSNELSYYEELKRNPRFGIGSYGKRVTKTLIKKDFLRIYKDSISHKSIVLVAEIEGKMVGICIVNGNAWIEAPHIGDVGFSVIKTHRNKGIGSALLNEAVRRSNEKFEILTANIFSYNRGSRHMLKKAGFKRWGYGTGFVKRGKIYMDNELLYLRLK